MTADPFADLPRRHFKAILADPGTRFEAYSAKGATKFDREEIISEASNGNDLAPKQPSEEITEYSGQEVGFQAIREIFRHRLPPHRRSAQATGYVHREATADQAIEFVVPVATAFPVSP